MHGLRDKLERCRINTDLEVETTDAYPEDWDGTGNCLMRAPLPPFLDPIAALDRFNWDKPVAIAELGGRACRTLQFIDDGQNRFILQPSGDLTSQAFWLDRLADFIHKTGFKGIPPTPGEARHTVNMAKYLKRFVQY